MRAEATFACSPFRHMELLSHTPGCKRWVLLLLQNSITKYQVKHCPEGSCISTVLFVPSKEKILILTKFL